MNNIIRFVLFSFLVFLISLETTAKADPLTSIYEVYTGPFLVSNLVYGNGLFVGVGNGFRMTSVNGTSWSVSLNPPILSQPGIAYGNEQYMTFGSNTAHSQYLICQSVDGSKFVPVYTNTTPLFSAAYGNNTWVFIGVGDIVCATISASNNFTWTEYEPSFNPTCITYANGSFVLGVIGYGAELLFQSTDGINWNYDSSAAFGNTWNAKNNIVSKGQAYLATSESINVYGNTNYYLQVSTNLINWTFLLVDTTPILVASDSGQFVVWAHNIYGDLMTSSYNCIFDSTNGYQWNCPDNSFPNSTPLWLADGDSMCLMQLTNTTIWAAGQLTPVSESEFTLNSSLYAGVTINGQQGGTYQIQYTTNLNNGWITATNLTLPHAPYIWVDTSQSAVGNKFYRAIQQW